MKFASGKLWATINNNEIAIRSLTQSDLEEALDILDKSFFLHEAVCNGSQINLPENVQARQELRGLCRRTASDGVSLVAKDVASGKIVAVSFNKIQYIPENDEEPFFVEFRNKSTHSPQAQSLMDFMIAVDGERDVFELFQIDCVLELMFLATLPAWEGKGIGRNLARHTIELARLLSQGIGTEEINPQLRTKRPRAVTALFTSTYSQRVGASQGFKVINTVPYTQFSFNGKTFAERIDPIHPDCQHVVLLF